MDNNGPCALLRRKGRCESPQSRRVNRCDIQQPSPTNPPWVPVGDGIFPETKPRWPISRGNGSDSEPRTWELVTCRGKCWGDLALQVQGSATEVVGALEGECHSAGGRFGWRGERCGAR